MAALESEGLCEIAMKPKLLRSLLREYVPDERHPFTNPSELLYVVSTVKTHKLLSEWSTPPVKPDIVEAWKSAVDSWVHRLLTLASSNLADKSWAGICLLGLTSQECSSDRFLTSYAVWLDKLLSCLQLPDVSNIVKAASCASLSDMFTRLSGFSNAKKDGNSHATKVIQPVLKLLIEDSYAVVLEGATCLLCTLAISFPLSVHRHYDDVEAGIVSKIMSGKCCESLLKKLAYCLSLLPRARGDEDSWSLMMDKIMLHMNSQLNDALQGLEEEAINSQIMTAILPAGKEPPPPLGGLDISERTSDLSCRRPERLLGSGLSTLMQCCCDMLTNFYPVMVQVPVSGLVALAGRVLAVDASSPSSSYSFMTTLKQEFIYSEIPLLQLHSLEILAALVKVLRSQLLPHAAGIVQLLVEYSRACKSSDLKIKVYSILKLLLMAMGVGTAIHISQDIVNIVCIDLEFLDDKKDVKSAGTQTMVHPELLTGSRQRKRKHSFLARSSQEQLPHNHLEVENPHHLAPISLKIAALETLEALLTVGGSMKSERWRASVDHLLISVATNACKDGWSIEEKRIFLSGDPSPTWTDFQLASLRTLLASLLSPGHTRPPLLGLALHLFRRGMQETSTKISEYCGHALLALEVLIHPRSLPLTDSRANEYNLQTNRKWQHNTTHHSREGQISTYHIGKSIGESESEDELNENWLENNNETATQITETRMPHSLAGGPPPVEAAAATDLVSEKIDAIMAGDEDNTHESWDFENSNTKQRTAGGVGPASVLESVPVENEVAADVLIPEVGPATGHEVEEDENDQRSTIVERISAMFASDRELSEGEESLPDIVDGDPDSD